MVMLGRAAGTWLEAAGLHRAGLQPGQDRAGGNTGVPGGREGRSGQEGGQQAWEYMAGGLALL